MPAEAPWSPARSPAEKDQILRRRAEELARPEPAARSMAEGLEVLVFDVARRSYAVAAACVREVQRLQSLTPLPGAPAYVLGMVHVRGQVLAVLDLRSLLDRPAQDLADLDHLIILHRREQEFGILADSIAGTRMLSVEGLRPPDPPLRACRGITMDGIALLDGEQLLTDPRLQMEEEQTP